jgi:hypothetical protein
VPLTRACGGTSISAPQTRWPGDRLGQIFHVDENALYTIVSSPDHDQTFLQKTGKAAYWTLVQWQQGVFPAMSANSSKRNRASADEIR